MRFGTWNVGSMYRAGCLRAAAEEISCLVTRHIFRLAGNIIKKVNMILRMFMKK
jgi:hypothetical protein